MFSFSQNTGYAILALLCLNHCGAEWVQSRQIAKCTGIPLPYLLKILNRLTHNGLILSKRGYVGGYGLAHRPTEISLLQVVEAMEGPNWTSKCIFGLKHCHREPPCPLHQPMLSQQDSIAKLMAKTKLADLGLPGKTDMALPSAPKSRMNPSIRTGRDE